MQNRIPARHKAAKHEPVAGQLRSRLKARKKDFKTAPWYSVAAGKLSAVRTTDELAQEEVPVTKKWT